MENHWLASWLRLTFQLGLFDGFAACFTPESRKGIVDRAGGFTRRQHGVPRQVFTKIRHETTLRSFDRGRVGGASRLVPQHVAPNEVSGPLPCVWIGQINGPKGKTTARTGLNVRVPGTVLDKVVQGRGFFEQITAELLFVFGDGVGQIRIHVRVQCSGRNVLQQLIPIWVPGCVVVVAAAGQGNEKAPIANHTTQ